jgi:hypothetical protein
MPSPFVSHDCDAMSPSASTDFEVRVIVWLVSGGLGA